MPRQYKLIIPIFCLFMSISGLALGDDACKITPAGEEISINRDDLAGHDLEKAIESSLKFLKRQPTERVFRFCDREYMAPELINGLDDFLLLSRQNLPDDKFAAELKERFEILATTGREENGSVLVTGYFEPLLQGSLQRTSTFAYPLYGKPEDLVTLNGQAGRLVDGRIVPYWSRGQIEKEELLQGNELVFLDDPVESFILHVQGSGQIQLRDGSIRRIHFAAKNGLPYRSIGRFLVEQGKMNIDEVTLPAIVDYLKSHQQERDNILHYNQSFVFFEWSKDDTSPVGSLGEPLTAGRSIALDQSCFPSGALGFLKTRQPIYNIKNEIIGWAPLHRFVLNQDSGSAIQGAGRVDLFLGAGVQARSTAGLMKHPGKLYFLIKKK